MSSSWASSPRCAGQRCRCSLRLAAWWSRPGSTSRSTPVDRARPVGACRWRPTSLSLWASSRYWVLACPTSLKVFLTALAIADDIGAILVIAVFYTQEIATTWLVLALVPFAVMVIMNRMGYDEPLGYLAVGTVLWFCVFNSGIHATIAGVIAAFTIPASAKLSPLAFTEVCRLNVDEIEEHDDPGAHTLEDSRQQRAALQDPRRSYPQHRATSASGVRLASRSRRWSCCRCSRWPTRTSGLSDPRVSVSTRLRRVSSSGSWWASRSASRSPPSSRFARA